MVADRFQCSFELVHQVERRFQRAFVQVVGDRGLQFGIRWGARAHPLRGHRAAVPSPAARITPRSRSKYALSIGSENSASAEARMRSRGEAVGRQKMCASQVARNATRRRWISR